VYINIYLTTRPKHDAHDRHQIFLQS